MLFCCQDPTLEKLHEQTFKSFESIHHIEFEKQKNKKCKGFKKPDLCSDREFEPPEQLADALVPLAHRTS